MSLENMLSEGQRAYCRITWRGNVCTTEGTGVVAAAEGLRGRGWWLKHMGFPLGRQKVPKLIVVMVAQLCEYTKIHGHIHSKWVNWVVSELGLHEAVREAWREVHCRLLIPEVACPCLDFHKAPFLLMSRTARHESLPPLRKPRPEKGLTCSRM